MAPTSRSDELAPGTVVQGLTIEASGQVLWLWLTFFALGNAFALFWLSRAFLNAHPEVAFKLRELLVRLGLRKPPPAAKRRRRTTGASAGEAAAAAAAAASGGGGDAAAAAAAAASAGGASAASIPVAAGGLAGADAPAAAAGSGGVFALASAEAAKAAAVSADVATARKLAPLQLQLQHSAGSPLVSPVKGSGGGGGRRSGAYGSPTRAGGRPSGEGGGALGSPMRSVRSRPVPPAELVEELSLSSIEPSPEKLRPSSSLGGGGGQRSPTRAAAAAAAAAARRALAAATSTLATVASGGSAAAAGAGRGEAAPPALAAPPAGDAAAAAATADAAASGGGGGHQAPGTPADSAVTAKSCLTAESSGYDASTSGGGGGGSKAARSSITGELASASSMQQQQQPQQQHQQQDLQLPPPPPPPQGRRRSHRSRSTGGGASSTSHSSGGGAGGERGAPSELFMTDEGDEEDEEDDDEEQPIVQLDWRNMAFAVRSPQGKRLIVQGVYGTARPYELQGLMGPSGAGKSTLMDLLAMRTDNNPNQAPAPPAPCGTAARAALLASGGGGGGGDVAIDLAGGGGPSSGGGADAAAAAADAAGVPYGASGRLLVNGRAIGRRTFMRISAYVPQHDNLVPTMTAHEAVSFYASVILPRTTRPGVRRARINNVLATMGLTQQAHTLVGGTLPGGIMLRGISGGERKRLAIACGVVAGPSLVFLDEPTSGLDSFAALNVVLFLKSMATHGGATLLASLHQPRAAIWGQLDQVTLLSSGRLMYTGATDGLVPWFSSLGYRFDPAAHGMASDWALDLVSLGFTKHGDAAHQHASQGGAGPDGDGPQGGGGGGGIGTPAGLRARGVGGVSGGSLSAAPLGGNSATAPASSYLVAGGRALPARALAATATTHMMCSKTELVGAAEAFLRQLEQQHADWFSGASCGGGGGDGDAVPPPLGLPAVKTARGSASHASTDDGGVTPFMTPMGAFDHPQQQQQAGPRLGQLAEDADAEERERRSAAGLAGAFGSPQPSSPLPHAVVPPVPVSSAGGASAGEHYQQQKQQLASGGGGGGEEGDEEDDGFQLVDVEADSGGGGDDAHAGESAVQRAGDAWHKYKALLWRELLITTRNPADCGGRMMTFCYVSLFSGLVSWSIIGTADSIFSRLSVAYAVLSFYLLMPFVFMSLFTSDKRFFAADTTARLYHPGQYFAAKVSIATPFNLAVAIVFHLVYYGMVGMRHGAVPMLASCAISVLMGLGAMQAVYCCAIMASSQDLAFVYAIAWTALNLLVNPYMAPFSGWSLGWGFSWLRFLSPFNYAWQALVDIELSGRGFDCNHGSGLSAFGFMTDLLPNTSSFRIVANNLANLGAISTNNTCVASGDAVVAAYTDGLGFWPVAGILAGYFLLFLAVNYVVVLRSGRARGKA